MFMGGHVHMDGIKRDRSVNTMEKLGACYTVFV